MALPEPLDLNCGALLALRREEGRELGRTSVLDGFKIPNGPAVDVELGETDRLCKSKVGLGGKDDELLCSSSAPLSEESEREIRTPSLREAPTEERYETTLSYGSIKTPTRWR